MPEDTTTSNSPINNSNPASSPISTSPADLTEKISESTSIPEQPSTTPGLDKLLLENQRLMSLNKKPPVSTPPILSTVTPSSTSTPVTPPKPSATPSPSIPTKPSVPPIPPTAPKTLQQLVQTPTATTPTPSTSPVKPASVAQAPSIDNSAPRKFSTSVRTMRDDIELLKKGVLSVPTRAPDIAPIAPIAPKPPEQPKPEIKTPIAPPIPTPEIPKPPTVTPTTTPVTVEPPRIIPEPISQPQPTIKIPEAPKPIIPTITPPPSMPEPTIPTIPSIPPAPKPPTPTIPNLSGVTPTLPPSRGGASVGIKPLYLIIIIVLVAVLGIGIYFIATNGGGSDTVTKTPVPTKTVGTTLQPTPNQDSLDLTFNALSLKVKPQDNLANLKALIRSYNAQQGQLVSFVIEDEATSRRLSLLQFFEKFAVPLPQDAFAGSLADASFVYGLNAEAPATTDSAVPTVTLRPFIVAKINNLQSLQQYLQAWEPTIVNSLAGVMSYEPNNLQFNQDFINGTPFKYIPDPKTGLAYTIIGQYLVITSSRDSFRAVTTKIFNLVNSEATPNRVDNINNDFDENNLPEDSF